MNYFDTDNDGKISLDELVTGLKREAKSEQKREKYRELFRGEREQLNISTVQNIVNGLALYMRRNKVSLASIFNEFDM
jgi:Ca2+-binding EF-hand superfamily protein